MEVQGRKENDGGSGSSGSEAHLFCQPCFGEGEHTEAEGFCKNCKEYLCATCITYHRKVTLSKHHVILDKQTMPSTKQKSTTTLTCTEICKKHGTEFVKFFCMQHQDIGCGDCMILGHKACKVDYIPDIAEEFVKGNEFRTLVKEVQRLKSVVKEMKHKTEKGIEDITITHFEAVHSIKQFRKEIDTYLDTMERELLYQCDKLKEESTHAVQNITDECHNAEKRLYEIHAQLTSEDQATGLFIKAKKTTPLIPEIDEKILHLDDRSNLHFIKFKRSPVINEMISNSRPLGEIETGDLNIFQPLSKYRKSIADLIPVKTQDINIKTSSDGGDSSVTSIVKVNEETLACTDWRNNKVKLVDISHSLVKDELSLPSPWDLACLSDNQLAVTLVADKKIQFLSTRDGLTKQNAISVNGKCRGIAYSKDRLYVTYENDPKVEIMTLDGKVLQCFQNDHSGSALFKWPLHVALSNDASYMYVSDNSARSVIKLSVNGEVIATYKDKDLLDTRKLAVCQDGSVLVCSPSQNNVHLISSECSKVKDVFEKSSGIGKCWAICYDDHTYTLYLGFSGRSKIETYTMK